MQTLNVSGLNTQSKRVIVRLDKTQLQAVHKKHVWNIKTHKLKVNAWGEIYHADTNQKKTGVPILILEKEDFMRGKLSGK